MALDTAEQLFFRKISVELVRQLTRRSACADRHPRGVVSSGPSGSYATDRSGPSRVVPRSVLVGKIRPVLLGAALVAQEPDLFIRQGVGCHGSGSHESGARGLLALGIEVHVWSALSRRGSLPSVLTVPVTLLRFGVCDQS